MTDVMIDDFLAHYGVAGMKWGKRRQEIYSDRKASTEKLRSTMLPGSPEYKAARKDIKRVFKEEMKKAKAEHQIDYGDELIGKAKGSVSRAGWNAVGKGIGKQVLISMGGMVAASIVRDPTAVSVVSQMANTASAASLIFDIQKGIAISKAKNS